MNLQNGSHGLQPAILLVGPTGSGKTPLGGFLEKNGFLGHRCVHFDFGENLRRVAQRKTRPAYLGVSSFAVVKAVLSSGSLLKARDFHIAEEILSEFTRRRSLEKKDFLVLNGLPRHRQQARDIAAIVEVRLVVNLECRADVVMSRIMNDAGGDRAVRVDDSSSFVRRKLEIFRRKTIPLLDHYRRKKVLVTDVEIAEDTTPAETVRCLASKANISGIMMAVCKAGKGRTKR